MERDVKKLKNVVTKFRGAAAKVGAGATGALVSGLAMAQTSSPGAAIAGELSGGKSEVMLVVSAVAIIVGLLVLWTYIKRAK